MEKAKQNYQKCIEKSDGNIQEQDKLRVASSDKEALAQRSKEELNRQNVIFEKQNTTFNGIGSIKPVVIINNSKRLT